MSTALLPNISLGSQWRNYCVYSGRHLPENAMSDEHVIPRSLGGTGATVIRCCKVLNSRLGHEIDGKVANDPMIIYGRRDANARGNSGKLPLPIIKGAAAWKRGDPWGVAEPHYNIEVPAAEQAVRVYDTRTGKYLPFSVFSDTGFVTKFKIDNNTRAKFVAKTVLGLGWKLFGERFLEVGKVGSLRQFIGSAEESDGECSSLYYMDTFMLQSGHPGEPSVKELERQVVRKGKTTILMRQNEYGFEWTVSCVGYMVGSMILPIAERLLPVSLAPEGGIMLVVNGNRLQIEAVEPFEARWS